MALYFNEQQRVEKKVIGCFRRSGVMHVLSASGLHVGVIAAIPMLLSSLFLFSRNICRMASLVLIVFYLFLSGEPVALMRASLMFGLFILQEILWAERNIFNILFFSAIIILIMRPEELFSLAFQLSFGATAAILLFFSGIRRCFDMLPSPLGNSIAMTLSVYITVTPIILVSLKEINFSGILGNLVAVPVITLIFVASIIIASISPIVPAAASLAGAAVDRIYILLKSVMELTAGLPMHFSVPEDMVPFLMASPLAVGVIAAIPFRAGANLKALLLLTAMFSAMIIPLNLSKINPREIIILRETPAPCLIIRDGHRAVITGDIRDNATAGTILSIINSDNAGRCSLAITNPDFSNITHYSRIIRKCCVERCFLSSRFILASYMSPFFRLLEKDKIIPAFVDFSIHGLPQRNDKNNDCSSINIDSEKDIGYIYSSVAETIRSGGKAFSICGYDIINLQRKDDGNSGRILAEIKNGMTIPDAAEYIVKKEKSERGI
jgi:ComEC/Rec2-related protein